MDDFHRCGTCEFYLEHRIVKGVGNCEKLLRSSELPFWAVKEYDFSEVSFQSGLECNAWKLKERNNV